MSTPPAWPTSFRAVRRLAGQGDGPFARTGRVFRILGVDFGAGAGPAQVQLTAVVNGVRLVYPSLIGEPWLCAGQQSIPQGFRTPATDQYNVRFELKFRAEAEHPPRDWHGDQPPALADRPFRGSCHLRSPDPARTVTVEVRFALEDGD